MKKSPGWLQSSDDIRKNSFGWLEMGFLFAYYHVNSGIVIFVSVERKQYDDDEEEEEMDQENCLGLKQD